MAGHFQAAGLQPGGHVVLHLHSRRAGVGGDGQRILLQLRRGRQPAHALGPHVVVDHGLVPVPLRRQGRNDLAGRQGFVAPLVAMGIEERRAVHLPRRARPIQPEGQRLPAGLRAQFLLPDIMRPPTAGLADRTAEHQHVDRAAIAHIHMIPMVDRRPDDDHRAAIGLFRIGGKFAGDRNDRLALHPGDAFRPGRGKRRIVIVRPRHVAAAKTTIEAVIGQHQVIHRRHRHAATAGQRDATHRQVAGQNLTMVGGDKMLRRPAAEIREIHGRNLGTFPSQAQPQRYLIALPVFRLQVPFALLAPAIAERTKRGHQRAGPLIKGDRLPLRIIGLPQRARQFGTAQQPFRHQPAIPFHQPHQERHIGVAAGIVGEKRHAAVEVEFAQNHMAHRQCQRGVRALLGGEPDIGEFGRLGVIRADHR